MKKSHSPVDLKIASIVGWARCAWKQTRRLPTNQARTVAHHCSPAVRLVGYGALNVPSKAQDFRYAHLAHLTVCAKMGIAA